MGGAPSPQGRLRPSQTDVPLVQSGVRSPQNEPCSSQLGCSPLPLRGGHRSPDSPPTNPEASYLRADPSTRVGRGKDKKGGRVGGRVAFLLVGLQSSLFALWSAVFFRGSSWWCWSWQPGPWCSYRRSWQPGPWCSFRRSWRPGSGARWIPGRGFESHCVGLESMKPHKVARYPARFGLPAELSSSAEGPNKDPPGPFLFGVCVCLWPVCKSNCLSDSLVHLPASLLEIKSALCLPSRLL